MPDPTSSTGSTSASAAEQQALQEMNQLADQEFQFKAAMAQVDAKQQAADSMQQK